MSYVVRFADLGRGDIAVAGGKGANLGELTRAGLPVPPGFVVTAAGYPSATDEGDVRDELRASLVSLREALESIRTLADSLERDPSTLLRGVRADAPARPKAP